MALSARDLPETAKTEIFCLRHVTVNYTMFVWVICVARLLSGEHCALLSCRGVSVGGCM